MFADCPWTSPLHTNSFWSNIPNYAEWHKWINSLLNVSKAQNIIFYADFAVMRKMLHLKSAIRIIFLISLSPKIQIHKIPLLRSKCECFIRYTVIRWYPLPYLLPILGALCALKNQNLRKLILTEDTTLNTNFDLQHSKPGLPRKRLWKLAYYLRNLKIFPVEIPLC